MRLFIAIPLPEEVQTQLSLIQKKLPEAKLNLVREFHLTLKFLGEVRETEVDKLKEALAKVKVEKFEAKLSRIGVFDEKFIKVLWVGVESEEKITRLQQEVEKALAGMVSKEDRFTSHVTLARVKYVKNKKEFLDKLAKIKPEKTSFTVKSFQLVKSTLTEEGSEYEVLGDFDSKA